MTDRVWFGLLLRTPHRLLYMLWVWLRPLIRRPPPTVDAIVLHLPKTLAAIPSPQPWFLRWLIASDQTLWHVANQLWRIAQESRVRTVLLILPELEMQLADLQTLRDLITRLRQRGKRVVCFAQTYQIAEYYVASAADVIALQTGGMLAVTGLQEKAFMVKPVLDILGITVETVATSPLKATGGTLLTDVLTPEAHRHIDALVDAQFTMVANQIAAARGVPLNTILAMIDAGLHTDEEALTQHYVDFVAYEEELCAQLQITTPIHWDIAQRWLPLPPVALGTRYIALLTIQGILTSNEQRWSWLPLPTILQDWFSTTVYDRTAVTQIRALTDDPNCAGVLLAIDCEGGSANASEAVYIALRYLAAERPVVAFFNGVAASGGYMIATPAHAIVAQPGTIVGSVGVIYTKYALRGLEQRFNIGVHTFNRGRHAGILKSVDPFTEEQKGIIHRMADRTAELFMRHITMHRTITAAQQAVIASGDVWTADQALQHGLVDTLGDLDVALRELFVRAQVPSSIPIRLISSAGKVEQTQWYTLHECAQSPATALRYVDESSRLRSSTPHDQANH